MTNRLDIANALIDQTLLCPCGHDNVCAPLCVSCECLLTLVQAVLECWVDDV